MQNQNNKKCSKCEKKFLTKNLEKWGNFYACKNCINDVKTWAQIIDLKEEKHNA